MTRHDVDGYGTRCTTVERAAGTGNAAAVGGRLVVGAAVLHLDAVTVIAVTSGETDSGATCCFGWDGINAADAAFQDAGGWVGVVFCVQAVGSLLWAAFLPKLEHWTGNKGAYAISLLVGAIGFISIWFVTNQYVLFLSYALIGAAWAAMLALPFTIVTNAIKGGNMGYYLGLFNCTICIPQIVAALCGGLLLKYICAHVQAGMLVVAGVLLVLGAASVFLIKEK